MKSKLVKKLETPKAVKWFWIIITAPFALLILLLLLTGIGLFGKLPSFEELENPKSNISTEIYSEDGEMIGSFFVQNRSYVDYDELSPNLVAALVATEDMRFYSHSGIDFISLARVAFKTLALGNRSQGGGSTITQQLAKNLFPRDTAVYSNAFSRNGKLVISKLKEWITAVKLEYNYTKEEIIAMYLNIVPYGSNAYGIKSAARTFFNKTPAELSIEEAAMLVGVVNAPTRYSPKRNPENALRRRNTVLDRMRRSDFIGRATYDSVTRKPIALDYHPVSHNEGSGTYFREMLRQVMNAPKPKRSQFNNDWDYEQELDRWENNPIYGWCEKNTKADGTPYNLYRDGLKIYTTLNATMQRYAEEALVTHMSETIQPKMDAQVKRYKRLYYDVDQAAIDRSIRNAMRYSDRYRNLKNQGATEEEIARSFDTPVEMRVFSDKGDRDTVMTPRDSILYHKQIMRAAFMAMDPMTGYVKAYVGGPNFRYFKYDMVKQGKRQVGSTIKPLIYTFAIDQLGFTPCTMVPNLQVTIESYAGDAWTPKEASKVEYDGVLHPLKWGLARSRNNYSAWIMKQAKQPQAVADFIHRFGIRSYIDPVYALCLGTPDFSLFEMVGAYGTFVNRGVHTEPIFVTRIEDRQGNVLASFTPQTSDVISEQTAYTMLGMLQNVVTSGTAGRLKWMYGFDGEIGGKTGTSQKNADGWFMGVTPKLVAGAWMGGEDPSIRFLAGGEGAAVALPIFGGFMKRVYADPRLGIKKTDLFPRPAGAVSYDCDEQNTGSGAQETYNDYDEFFN